MVSRREFLGVTFMGGAAAAALAGCGGDADSSLIDGALPAVDADPAAPDAAPTPQCAETPGNPLGPYYRADAPIRTNLVDPGVTGTPLSVAGRVIGITAACTPLAGAVVDVWQADRDGVYDNQTGDPGPTVWILRGRTTTAADGSYAFQTIIPGNYQTRAAHIHILVTAAGFRNLVTQIYMPGDQFLATDPSVIAALILAWTDAPAGGKKAPFDFVLEAA